jgi:hypothetical protein
MATRRPSLGGGKPFLGQARLLEEAHRIEDLARLAGRNIDPLGQMGADGHEDGVKAPSSRALSTSSTLWLRVSVTPAATMRATSLIQHLAGQAVSGNAEAQHAAGERARLADLHLMAEPVEVPGAGEAGGAGTDHQHLLAAGGRGRRRLPATGQRLVAEEALDGVNGDGIIHLGTVAGRFAG